MLAWLHRNELFSRHNTLNIHDFTGDSPSWLTLLHSKQPVDLFGIVTRRAGQCLLQLGERTPEDTWAGCSRCALQAAGSRWEMFIARLEEGENGGD